MFRKMFSFDEDISSDEESDLSSCSDQQSLLTRPSMAAYRQLSKMRKRRAKYGMKQLKIVFISLDEKPSSDINSLVDVLNFETTDPDSRSFEYLGHRVKKEKRLKKLVQKDIAFFTDSVHVRPESVGYQWLMQQLNNEAVKLLEAPYLFALVFVHTSGGQTHVNCGRILGCFRDISWNNNAAKSDMYNQLYTGEKETRVDFGMPVIIMLGENIEFDVESCEKCGIISETCVARSLSLKTCPSVESVHEVIVSHRAFTQRIIYSCVVSMNLAACGLQPAVDQPVNNQIESDSSNSHDYHTETLQS